MKYLFHFVGTLLIVAFISIVVSMLTGAVRYIGYLLALCERPTWPNVFGMAALLFIIMVVRGLIQTGTLAYRFWKYPKFKRAYLCTGIGWSNWKRLMKEEGYEL